MHDTAHAIGRKFVELYAPSEPFLVIEVGSQDVNGTLRTTLPPQASYWGIDLVPCKNVDVVAMGSALPVASATADIVLASSVIEHDMAFWMTVLELCRITKPGGYIYLSAPSNGAVHRYPQDCWRFYPDAGPALVAWARRNGCDVSLVEAFTAARAGDQWNDFVAVLCLGACPPRPGDQFVHAHVPSTNVHCMGSVELLRPSEWTEDQQLLGKAVATLLGLEARAADIVNGGKSPSMEAPQRRKMENMLRLIGSVPDLSDRAVLRSRIGQPFAATFDVISSALDGISSGFGNYKRAAEKREQSLRRRLLLAREAQREVRGAAAQPSQNDIWFSIDKMEPGRIYGWAFHSLEPERRLNIAVVAGIELAGTVSADRLRPDLARLGYGDGRYGFVCEPGNPIQVPMSEVRILARWEGHEVQLIPRLPSAVEASLPAEVESARAESRRYPSRAPCRSSGGKA